MRYRLLFSACLLAAVQCSAAATASAMQMPSGMHVDSAADFTSCGGTLAACQAVVVSTLNADRAAHHLPLLRLDVRQSAGTTTCVGSMGHSIVMAHTGTIWHVDSRHKNASFPRDICAAHGLSGENVGAGGSGTPRAAIATLDRMMMSEPHTSKTCKTTFNHACNILNSGFTRVGVGLYVDAAGTTWLTEDFLG